MKFPWLGAPQFGIEPVIFGAGASRRCYVWVADIAFGGRCVTLSWMKDDVIERVRGDMSPMGLRSLVQFEFERHVRLMRKRKDRQKWAGSDWRTTLRN